MSVVNYKICHITDIKLYSIRMLVSDFALLVDDMEAEEKEACAKLGDIPLRSLQRCKVLEIVKESWSCTHLSLALESDSSKQCQCTLLGDW